MFLKTNKKPCHFYGLQEHSYRGGPALSVPVQIARHWPGAEATRGHKSWTSLFKQKFPLKPNEVLLNKGHRNEPIVRSWLGASQSKLRNSRQESVRSSSEPQCRRSPEASLTFVYLCPGTETSFQQNKPRFYIYFISPVYSKQRSPPLPLSSPLLPTLPSPLPLPCCAVCVEKNELLPLPRVTSTHSYPVMSTRIFLW